MVFVDKQTKSLNVFSPVHDQQMLNTCWINPLCFCTLKLAHHNVRVVAELIHPLWFILMWQNVLGWSPWLLIDRFPIILSQGMSQSQYLLTSIEQSVRAVAQWPLTVGCCSTIPKIPKSVFNIASYFEFYYWVVLSEMFTPRHKNNA